MVPSLLIANRGEIAVRIARTARRLGVRTIAVHTAVERHLPHVAVADEAYEIGAGPVRESYLDQEKLLRVAAKSGAAAVHPGYGFLSENADFAENCRRAGLVFVGPPVRAIRAMAAKDAAKALMMRAGVPVVPGYHGDAQEPKFLREKAYRVGYPVVIKAVAGGGGKGMRLVGRAVDFEEALASCRREALAAFGDDRVLIERYVDSPRHIEVQVFADSHGNAIHLGERDCTLQRRHQKILEEAPAPGVGETLRAEIGAMAVEAARAVGYEGAGTVEFIADASEGLSAERIHFMEMNTRLQVEHPVTEAVTGLDLVEWQLRIASGEPLPLKQDEVRLDGHAVEARLYAEDPSSGFLPSTGRIALADWPEGEGVRVDAGYGTGDSVEPFFDPMLAKIIASGPDRESATMRLLDALANTVVAGPRTNLAFLRRALTSDAFREATFDTGWVDRNLAALTEASGPGGVADAIRVLLPSDGDASDPWTATDGFEVAGLERRLSVPVEVNGERCDARLRYAGERLHIELGDEADGLDGEGPERLLRDGDRIYVLDQGRQTVVSLVDPLDASAGATAGGSGDVAIPMHGRVIRVFVKDGQRVEAGDRLFALEAMKMEHTVTAPFDGTVVQVDVAPEAQVREGELAVTIEPAGVS